MAKSYDLLRGRGPLYLSAEEDCTFPLDVTDRVKAKTAAVQPSDSFVTLNEAAASGRNGEGVSFAGGTIDVDLSQVMQWFKPGATDDGSRPSINALLIMGTMGNPTFTNADVGVPSKILYDAIDYACDSSPGCLERLQETCTQNEFQVHRVSGIRGNLVFEFNKEEGSRVMLEGAKGAEYTYFSAGPQTATIRVTTVNDSTLYSYDVDGNTVSYTSDADATVEEIVNGLVADHNGNATVAAICTASNYQNKLCIRGLDLTTAYVVNNLVSDIEISSQRAAWGTADLGKTSSNPMMGFFGWEWSIQTVESEPVIYGSESMQSLRISMAVEITEQDGPGGSRGVVEIDPTIGAPIEFQMTLKNRSGDENWIRLAQANEYFKFQATITNPKDSANQCILGDKNGGIFLQLNQTPTKTENGNWEFCELNAITVYPEAVPGDLLPAETYNTMFSLAFTGDALP